MHESKKELEELVAPCGMNCRLCMAYQREKKHCNGCNMDDTLKTSISCLGCIIKNCPTIKNSNSGFCFECEKYPCQRLKQLDQRYSLKYHMSMIENLETIKQKGLAYFLDKEEIKWACPKCGNIICVHRNICPNCQSVVFKDSE